MSVWSWKRSGWLTGVFVLFLATATLLSISSVGFRSRFKAITSYLSFDGGYYPEMGFFNAFLYLSILTGLLCISLRYVFVADQNLPTSRVTNLLNVAAFFPGILSFIGLLTIASFPSISKLKDGLFQAAGTFMFFGMGVIFSAIHTTITYLQSKFCLIFVIRAAITIALTASCISFITLHEMHKAGSFAFQKNESVSNTTVETGETVDHDNPVPYIVFGLERIFVMFYALFFLSFFPDFQKISTYVIIRPLIMSHTSDDSSRM
ncbi:DNA damage-regulated autophagy modulator protein 2, partial [Stegodyphus mimosarum]